MCSNRLIALGSHYVICNLSMSKLGGLSESTNARTVRGSYFQVGAYGKNTVSVEEDTEIVKHVLRPLHLFPSKDHPSSDKEISQGLLRDIR